MRILITGGTGYIGRRLGAELVRQGHELVALVRDAGKARKELPYPAELVPWEGAILRDIDAVIHLAGEAIAAERWSAARKKKILESRTDTMKKLLGLLQGAQGRKPSVILSASGIGYYGEGGDKLLNEESASRGGFLADTCKEWERSVREASPFIPRVVCLRIGMVLGRHGGALQKILPIFKRGFGGKLGSGRQWVSWIHLDDLVQVFLFALKNSEVNGIYNAVAPEPVSNRDFTRAIAKALGVPAICAAPSFGLRMILGEMADLVLLSQKVSCQKLQGAGFKFRYAKIDDVFVQLCGFVEKRRGALFHEFMAEQWLPRPAEEVFPFFTEAKNLEGITPPFLQFKMLKQSTPQVQEGTVFDYSFRHHGMSLAWRSMILDWKENQMFTDTQQEGPYTFWYHTHSFERLGAGTLMRDRIVYRLPFGYLGDFVGHRSVLRDLDKIFAYRRDRICEKFWK